MLKMYAYVGYSIKDHSDSCTRNTSLDPFNPTFPQMQVLLLQTALRLKGFQLT